MFLSTSGAEYATLKCKILNNDENLPANFQNSMPAKEDPIKVAVLKASDLTNNDFSRPGTNSSDKEENENDSDSTDDKDFGEAECGEPSASQRLTIDFTLSNEDTEFTQQKCCDFWNFINSMPQLHHLMVIPEPEDIAGAVRDEVPGKPTSPETISKRYDSAIDALQKAADGPVPSAFVSKQPNICRDPDHHSYCHGSSDELHKDMMELRKRAKALKLKRSQMPTIEVQPARNRFLTSLCSQMEAWDLQHPQSFEPPHLAPNLTPETSPRGTSSVTTPKDKVCSSDVSCVACPPASRVETLDLQVKDGLLVNCIDFK